MPRRLRPADAAQLLLFESPSAAAQAEALPRQVVVDEPPPAPALAAPPVESPSAVPLDSVLGPASFRHPQASRELLLDSHLVGYELRRARRRSIGFVVGTEGLSVAAPRWVGIAEIESALREKAGWILRKLTEQGERSRRLTAARVDWRDGAVLPFLGEPMRLVLDARATGAMLHTALDVAPSGGRERLSLHMGLPSAATPQQIRELVQGWLQRQARRVFEERCGVFATRLGVKVRRLSLSSAQTRWGSASADGSIRLNWRLVHFALPTIDYVVAHELAHLRHMDHSPRFWEVVRSVIPDVDRLRGELRDEVLPVFD